MATRDSRGAPLSLWGIVLMLLCAAGLLVSCTRDEEDGGNSAKGGDGDKTSWANGEDDRGVVRFTLPGREAFHVEFVASDRYVVAVNREVAAIWDRKRGDKVAELSPDPGQSFVAALAARRRRVIYLGTTDKRVVLWRWEHGSVDTVYGPAADRVNVLSHGVEAGSLLIGDLSGSLRRVDREWAVRTSQHLGEGYVSALSVSEKLRKGIMLTADKQAVLFDGVSLDVSDRWGEPERAWAAAMPRDGNMVAIGYRGRVVGLDVAHGERRRLWESRLPGTVTALDTAEGGNVIGIGTSSLGVMPDRRKVGTCGVYVCRGSSGAVVASLPLDDEGVVSDVAFSQGGDVIAAVGAMQDLLVWNWRRRE